MAHGDLISDVYNHCVNSRINELDQMNRKRGASLVGQDLYEVLRAYLRNHVNKTRSERLETGMTPDGHEDLLSERLETGMTPDNHEDLLSKYVKEFSRYSAGSNFIRNVFSYLNRHWVKREIDEGNKGIYDIYNVSLIFVP